MTALYVWTMHGTKNHCSQCQAMAGVIKPIDAWMIHPGFHPHCGCTLDWVSGTDDNYVYEPTIYVSVLSYFLGNWLASSMPITDPNPPLLFPLCPFILGPSITGLSTPPVPSPITVFTPVVVPVIVHPPAPAPTPKWQTHGIR
jgi:hypothetical protein